MGSVAPAGVMAGHDPEAILRWAQLLALMIVIFVVGVTVDLGFGFADRAIRRRWGLA